jgi:membrane fusion protein
MVCALTIALVGFCSLGSYTKRETAKGVLTPETGIMTITAMTAGTVTALPVREGRGIKKANVLPRSLPKSLPRAMVRRARR